MSLVLSLLVLEEHVALGLEADAGPEEVDDAGALLAEAVDDGGADGDGGGLGEVGEDREDGVELLEALAALVGEGDTLAHLSDEAEIDHERGGEEGVLADVVHADGVETVAEDLGGVLIDGSLGVADVGDVLDDDEMVGLLAGLVEDAVGEDHVLDDAGLGDLLGAELLGGGEVLAVVVAEVVVGGDGDGLDAGVDEVLGEDGLDLGLTALEVVTGDVDVLTLGELDDTGEESVLGRTVDEGGVLEDAGDGEDVGRGDLALAVLDGLEDVVGSVVDAGDDVGVALGVGGPENNHLVETVLSLEVADVLADVVEVNLLVVAGDEVVGAVGLVAGDVLGVVDGGHGDHVLHVGAELLLEGVVEDGSTLHGVGHVHVVDIPAAEDQVVGIDEGDEVLQGNEDVAVLAGAETDSGGLGDGTVVVGVLDAVLGLPGDLVLVGEDTGGDGGAVVASPADEQNTSLGDLAVGLEGVLFRDGLHNNAVILFSNDCLVVHVLGNDGIFGVLDVFRINKNGLIGVLVRHHIS